MGACRGVLMRAHLSDALSAASRLPLVIESVNWLLISPHPSQLNSTSTRLPKRLSRSSPMSEAIAGTAAAIAALKASRASASASNEVRLRPANTTIPPFESGATPLQQPRTTPSDVGQQSPAKLSPAHVGWTLHAASLGGGCSQQSSEMPAAVGQQSPPSPSAAHSTCAEHAAEG